MFCNQCEQFSRGCATTGPGMCGKDPDIQSLQEIILYGLKGMAAYAHHARRLGMFDETRERLHGRSAVLDPDQRQLRRGHLV